MSWEAAVVARKMGVSAPSFCDFSLRSRSKPNPNETLEVETPGWQEAKVIPAPASAAAQPAACIRLACFEALYAALASYEVFLNSGSARLRPPASVRQFT